MLVGREAELQSVGALIDGAREGRGGAVVLRGDPGIGKTAILEWARGVEGMDVLSASGVESEAHLAFAALGEALRPVLGHRTRLAPAQRAALEAALALGPPAVPDRFAAYAGAFALVEAAASEAPLLLVIDDAQWLDAPSAEAMAFIARRLEDVPAAVLLAVRTGEGQDVTVAGAAELALAPLSADASRELIEAHAVNPLRPDVAQRVLALAAGNPLALIEVPRALSADERAGRAPLPEPLRVGEAITRAFRRRLEDLDVPIRRGLVVVAVGAEDAVEPLLEACGRAGSSLSALERAEGVGILTVGPARIGFAHPLIRGVVLELAAPSDVREAHRALAEAIAAERGLERRAWHLAQAAVGADETAAQALEQVGGAAAARTAYSTAADALARAAGLTAEPDDRARRLLQAAGLAQMSGQFPLAAGLLEQAAAAARNPALTAEIDHLRGLVRIYTGPMNEGIRLLFDSADAIARHSPQRAASMLVDASMAWGMVGQPAMCIVACRKARQLGSVDEPGRVKLELAMGNSLLFVGRGRETRGRAEELAALAATLDPLTRDHHAVVCGIFVQMYVGGYASAQREHDRAVAACRASGALGPLAFYLATGADLAFRTMRWSEGIAHAEEAFEIAMETGQIPIAAYALCVLGRLEGASGREAQCRGHLELAEQMAAALGTDALRIWGGYSLGVVELSRMDHEAAIGALEPVAELWDFLAARCAEAIPWQPDLIEAYVRVGRTRDARRRLRVLSEEAHGSGGPEVLALTSRCRGLIDPDYERHFGEALAHHARLPIPFDVARTQLLYGERLRRDRRRGRAREQLERALAGFEALGAEPWAERTRDELAAAGSPVAAPRPPSVAALTPRELQVAVAVARGATNREAASALFLSEKTIERHLSSVYAKLGLRSRAELARMLARGDPADERGIPPISPGEPSP